MLSTSSAWSADVVLLLVSGTKWYVNSPKQHVDIAKMRKLNGPKTLFIGGKVKATTQFANQLSVTPNAIAASVAYAGKISAITNQPMHCTEADAW